MSSKSKRPQPTGALRDTRIVYGAGCTYWGGIYSIGRGPVGLPGCPYCGGLLYEVQTEEEYLDCIDVNSAAAGDFGYSGFIRWNKGRPCKSLHPDLDGDSAFERLRAEYEAERQKNLQ
ncbi:hypothetical protein [Deinococcus alpinitundrae]|uniref:hypothetical protein n=1 Tax=Deinococcus alpinitundrae TaxID=468913 RepID=UPI00137B5AFE|nr:hypothetical protein [Deinococcus alpinitundrae]